MIEVLELGPMKKYTFTCRTCLSKLRFSELDIKVDQTMSGKKIGSITCPVCGRENTVCVYDTNPFHTQEFYEVYWNKENE